MRLRKPVLQGGSVPGDLVSGTIVLALDYEISNVAKMRMETLAVINLGNLPRGGASSIKQIKTVGTLELR